MLHALFVIQIVIIVMEELLDNAQNAQQPQLNTYEGILRELQELIFALAKSITMTLIKPMRH